MGARKPKHKNKPKQSSPRPNTSVANTPKLPAALEPKPWPVADEMAEDAAVFNGQALEKLSAALRAECEAVKSALELVEAGQVEAAATALQAIPRQSPYSDWRLFLRGLSDFYQPAYDEARQAWSRLAPNRRPARIACVLLDAVGQTRPESLASVAVATDALPVAQQTLDRTGIMAEAQKIIAARHANKRITFSPIQASMLRNFADRYRHIDKAFAWRFMRACVHASTEQAETNVFQSLRAFVPGPDYDPGWRLVDLLRSFHTPIEGEKKYDWLQDYFKNNLASNQHLTDAAKSALKSQLLYMLGQSIANSPDEFIEINLILQILREATESCPTNRSAHDSRVKLIEGLLDDVDDLDLDEEEQAHLQALLLKSLQNYAQAFPNDSNVARKLAQAYMENARFDEATKETERAIGLRDDSPKTKLLYWQIKLQKAMHAARTKAGFTLVDSMLDEAIMLWPTWLARDWIPFLKASAALRKGNAEASEQLRQQAIVDGKIPALTAALMAYVANQKFHVAAKDQKSYRAQLDALLAKINKCDCADLAWAASFLWDLDRTNISRSGMMQREDKLSQAIVAQSRKMDFTNDHGQACFCWLSELDFCDTKYEVFRKLATTPRTAAAYIDYLRSNGILLGKAELSSLVEIIEKGMSTESDAWYRPDMQETIDAAKEYLADIERPDSDFDDIDFDGIDKQAFQNMARAMAARLGLDPDKLPKDIFDLIGSSHEEQDDDDDVYDDDDDDLHDPGDDEESDLTDFFNRFHQPQDVDIPVPKPKTAAEMKAFNKQRQKDLQRARKGK